MWTGLSLSCCTSLLIHEIRHFLHYVVQLPIDGVLHLFLRETSRHLGQCILHLCTSALDIRFGGHSSKSSSHLLFDDPLDVLGRQLLCLSLSNYFLQRAYIKGRRRSGGNLGLRTCKLGVLLALSLGILKPLAVDGGELFLESTDLAVFLSVVLLGLRLRLFELAEAVSYVGSRAIYTFEIFCSVLLDLLEALFVMAKVWLTPRLRVVL